MDKKYVFSLDYSVSGKKMSFSGRENEDFSLQTEETANGLKITLLPKKEIELQNAYLHLKRFFANDEKVYVNGYQSWTTSREYGKDDIQYGLLKIARYQPVRYFCTVFGDYEFQNYSLQPGQFHSYSYTYIRTNGKFELMGTLNERTGYTVFHYDMNKGTIDIQKDVEGVSTNKPYVLFELYFTEGQYEEIFDEYFRQLSLPPLKIRHMAGYTSWYNYYGKISEAILERDIDGLATMGKHADIFQIDDGYQKKTGDWTTINTAVFPKGENGLKYLTDKIHSKGYKAGLWVAPFSVAHDSEVLKNHPDWIIKDPKTGKNQYGSISWGGAYTLDFYVSEAREYIKNFFSVILNDWNFDMVKLDFLYSVCQTPRHNKSRGQIMCEAMDFLRECVGEKLLLGCGVPLFPAFGKVDACRISSDVGWSYKPIWFNSLTNQEIVSTRSAMNNTIFRRHLNGRAFVNDPDVFYLRDSDVRKTDPLAVKKSKLNFTEEQKIIHATINNMCGDVLFVSDNVGGYTEEKRKLLETFFAPTDKKVIDAQYVSKDDVEIIYEQEGKKYRLSVHLPTGKNNLMLL